MNEFGKRLRQLRTGKKLSQSALAKQIGISKSSVNMYERGEREPSFETLETIADYFNVDIDYLIGRNLDTPDTNEITISVQVDKGLFSERAQPTLTKLATALNTFDKGGRECINTIRSEMEDTFTEEDFLHLIDVLKSINSEFEKLLKKE